MTDRLVCVLQALFFGAAAVLVAAAAISGELHSFLNPRVVPRTVVGVLAIGALFAYRAVRSTRARSAPPHRSADPHTEPAVRSAFPPFVLVPFLLLPAALNHSSTDFTASRVFSGTFRTGGAVESSAATVPGPGAIANSSGILPQGGGTSPQGAIANSSGILPQGGGASPQGAIPNSSGIPPQGRGAPPQGAIPSSGGARNPDGAGSGPDNGSWIAAANPDLLEAVGAAGSAQLIPERGPIRIVDSRFSEMVHAIWDRPEHYLGRPVELTVFVYRGDSWPAEVFAASRMAIWCCAADAQVVGLLASTEAGAAPATGSWIRISGTLAVRSEFAAGPLRMERVPELVDVRWHPVPAPASEYVLAAF